MSNFAQIITSFERTGNFPLEANYIFASVEALKEFYSDEVQAATLHKGLLRIVERNSEGKQAIYWVTKKETNDELEFTELVAGQNIEEIKEALTSLNEKLEAETTQRKNADISIWGLNDPSNLEEGYNSINDLGTQVKSLQNALEKLDSESVSGDNSLKSQLKAVIGTESNDIVEYMNSLPYTTITELAQTLDKFLNGTIDSETGTPVETEILDTLPDLIAFLDGFTTSDTLKQLLEKLWFKLEGSTLPSEEFRTLRGIEDFIVKYKTENDYTKSLLTEEINNLETGVGLNPDGSFSPDSESYYLTGATSIMNALQILDKLLHKYISANTPSVRNTDDAVQLSLTQELDSYVLAASLKISTQAGNQVVKNSDGLYSCAKTYYENGVLTFRVNGNIVSQHYIGMNAIINDAHYDKDNEQLVFVFKLQSGDTQTVNVPVGALIREWEPYNKDNSAVILERTESTSGTDQLSADIRISTDQWNILEKVNGALYVKGTSEVIYHKGTTLLEYLDSEKQSASDTVNGLLVKLEEARLDREAIRTTISAETTARAQADLNLDSKISTLGDSVLVVKQAVETETAERKKAVETLNQSILVETNRASVEESRLQQSINSEAERAKQIEEQHASRMSAIDERLTNEIDRATAKDAELDSKIAFIKHDEYSVIKQSTPEDGCIATYVLTKNGSPVGSSIDVPETPVNISLAFEKGIITLVVNGQSVGTANLNLTTVQSSLFDLSSEEIVSVFNLIDGSTQTVKTSLHSLIQYILEKHKTDIDTKAPIDSPILTGIPQVETSPDDEDSSQRIPSTAWVQQRLKEAYGASWIDVD